VPQQDGALMRPRVVLVPDGMADEPLAALGGRTPLQAAATPVMDAMAACGVVGLVRTVPEGMVPGSDVANLSVLGYDAAAVYSGRAPLEAAGIGVDLGPDDVAYRCNLVTIADGVMRDNTAGHVPDGQAAVLIDALAEAFAGSPFEFYAGVGYRHLLVWRGGELAACTPPHDILDRPTGPHLPAGHAGPILRRIMQTAHEVLGTLRPGTDIWLWGEGRAPHMPRFADLYGLHGAAIGAVDLVRGLGVYAGLDVLDVPGATGGLDTDYAAKGRVAHDAVASHDFVYVHVEAPDEAAHMGSVEEKVRAIERIDADVLAPLWESDAGPAVLVLPDHATPIRTRTHAKSPVPFVYAVPHGSVAGPGSAAYDEAAAAAGAVTMSSGAELMTRFLGDTA
jgi:2,3-bisphosphoglycerate-independent phosphoglycerate mutase